MIQGMMEHFTDAIKDKQTGRARARHLAFSIHSDGSAGVSIYYGSGTPKVQERASLSLDIHQLVRLRDALTRALEMRS